MKLSILGLDRMAILLSSTCTASGHPLFPIPTPRWVVGGGQEVERGHNLDSWTKLTKGIFHATSCSAIKTKGRGLLGRQTLLRDWLGLQVYLWEVVSDGLYIISLGFFSSSFLHLFNCLSQHRSFLTGRGKWVSSHVVLSSWLGQTHHTEIKK